MLICDNPQATIPSGWFAGFLEGEGNFNCSPKGKNGGRIRITNTDLDLIEACESFLKNNNICYYTQRDSQRKGKKDCYTIYIRNNKLDQFYEYCKVLYTLISDKIECRKSEYDKLLGIESSTTTCVLSIDLDWLIGVSEAEGTLCFINNYQQKLQPCFAITNTNSSIINKVQINLDALNCTYHISDVMRRRADEEHKYAQVVKILGLKRCYKFLLATKEKWISRRNIRRSDAILQFIESRFKKDIKEEYDVEELRLVQIVKDLNLYG